MTAKNIIVRVLRYPLVGWSLVSRGDGWRVLAQYEKLRVEAIASGPRAAQTTSWAPRVLAHQRQVLRRIARVLSGNVCAPPALSTASTETTWSTLRSRPAHPDH